MRNASAPRSQTGAAVAALPGTVVGAAGLMLFATVTMVGINTLRRVDLGQRHNLTIASVSRARLSRHSR
ncbi:solute carrier family 23 protein [Streptomyces sp. NPDC048479]|uniref:solute carrier family 23 protein n=1 Tax=Streptomyces sp. NPDC048479 TaxID=3154725 RepID=UPI00342886C1